MARSSIILVACCDDVQCMILKSILAGRMFQVYVVQDSEEVISAIESYNPALLIMDIEFPKSQLSGWKLARKVRREFKLTPLIFLLIHPGHTYEYLEPEYERLYNHILVMPVDVEEIWQSVKKLLGVYPWGGEWDSQIAMQVLKSVEGLSET